MEFPTISQSGITDDNSRLFPEIPIGVGTLYKGFLLYIFILNLTFGFNGLGKDNLQDEMRNI